jgi:hypothetical protein
MRVGPDLTSFPAHALLILEERLAEQEAEGVEMPEGVKRDELALRIGCGSGEGSSGFVRPSPGKTRRRHAPVAAAPGPRESGYAGPGRA